MMLAPIFALIFPVIAQQSAPETPAATPPGEVEGVEVPAPEETPVCRERGEDVGSNIRRRQTVCLTRDQIRAERRQAERALADANREIARANATAAAAAEPGSPAAAPVMSLPGPED